MNPCIKTGCDVYITSHGTVLHGDLYKLDSYYILRYGIDQPFKDDRKSIAKCYARFDDALAENMSAVTHTLPRVINFDTSQYGTLIIHQGYVECEV